MRYDIAAAAAALKFMLEHDETRLIRNGNGSELPLPLWER
jgi:hypothetical protein